MPYITDKAEKKYITDKTDIADITAITDKTETKLRLHGEQGGGHFSLF